MTTPLIIVNPAAGRGHAAAVWARVRHLAPGVTCHATEGPGHARHLAAEGLQRGAERVIAVGGDGTVSEVASALAETECALGIVPAGTGNDFSAALRIPHTAEHALRLALDAASRPIDYGAVRIGQQLASFVNVAGCGFDAEVVRRTAAARHLRGPLPYFVGIIRTLFSFRPRRVRLDVDGQHQERTTLGIAVAIGPQYGGGMRVAPDAVVDDGLFELCVIGNVRPLQLLALLPKLYVGTHAAHPAVELVRCRDVSIAPVGASAMRCQLDGELAGSIPATFSLRERALQCITGACQP